MKRLMLVAVCALIAGAACGSGDGSRVACTVAVGGGHVELATATDFPVLVSLTDYNLRTGGKGGLVRLEDGGDIRFYLAGSKKPLPHEIAYYDPAIGSVRAWVRIPALSAETGTLLDVKCWNPDAPMADRPAWDDDFTVVRHFGDDYEAGQVIDVPDRHSFLEGLTVEAWVTTDDFRPEATEPLVAQWSRQSSFDLFDAYDAGNTDDLRTIGYFGAVFDGRYVYFSPQRYGHEEDSTHGFVLRYDTHGGFRDRSSWSANDAGNTDGLATRGHYGAVFDGRYVYFVPRGKNYGGTTRAFNEFQSNLLRYDTRGGFKDPSSWSAYDMGEDLSKQSAAFDGRYIYFCPGYAHEGDSLVGSSRIIRFDTESPFKNPSSYRTIDVSRLLDAETGNYDGAIFAGRYVYFVPLVSGVALRYDTRGDYGDAGSWATYDAKPLGMKMNVGAMFDGRWVYFAAYGHGVIVRCDTEGDFTSDASWESYDASVTGGLDTAGFDGGFFDGRYVYFAPFVSPRQDGGWNFHTNWLRYDTAGGFGDPASWDAAAADETDGLPTIGYNGGASDGRYLYLAPWQDGTDGKFGIHGNVLRYDTTGGDASFCLSYCDLGHNGGLNAAVPGPGFIVNTDRGPVSVNSHEPLLPGGHYLAGVYDGRSIRLYVDGELAAERPARGNIVESDVPLVVGGFHEGTAHFRGVVHEVRISRAARGDGWIRTAYRNLADPSGFASVVE